MNAPKNKREAREYIRKRMKLLAHGYIRIRAASRKFLLPEYELAIVMIEEALPVIAERQLDPEALAAIVKFIRTAIVSGIMDSPPRRGRRRS